MPWNCHHSMSYSVLGVLMGEWRVQEGAGQPLGPWPPLEESLL